jgi:hypothetical protein
VRLAASVRSKKPPSAEVAAKIVLEELTRSVSVRLDFQHDGIAMAEEEWIKILEDGRKVKFTYLELPEEGAFITAQIAGNKVVY